MEMYGDKIEQTYSPSFIYIWIYANEKQVFFNKKRYKTWSFHHNIKIINMILYGIIISVTIR